MSKYEGHTPGDWIVFDHYHPGIDSKEGPSIVVFGEAGEALGVRGKPRAQSLANARLIADAPKLLEQRDALLEAMKEARDASFHGGCLHVINKAIEKVEKDA